MSKSKFQSVIDYTFRIQYCIEILFLTRTDYPKKFSILIFSEVLKALLKTRDLFESWKMGEEGRDLRSAEEQEWSTTELRNSLRSIEWDLEVRFDKMMFL